MCCIQIGKTSLRHKLLSNKPTKTSILRWVSCLYREVEEELLRFPPFLRDRANQVINTGTPTYILRRPNKMADDEGDDGTANQSQFFAVPNEVTEQILSYLSPYGDLQQSKLVCKTWHSLVLRIIAQKQRIFYESICNGELYFETIPQRSRIPPRYSHSSCVLGSSMYVFGGCSSSNTAFNDIYELDLIHYKWTKLRLSGISPPPKECVSMVVHNNRIVLFGGWCPSARAGIVSNAKFHNNVNILDVPSLTWRSPFKATDWPQPFERAGHAACVVQDQMIVFGGAQRLTRLV